MATYSFADVHLAITGPGIAAQIGGDGAANAEEGLTIEKMAKNTMNVGADGSPMHSMHASEAGKIIVRLQKTSPVNFLLSAAYQLQRQQSSNWGANVMVLTDVMRGDTYTMTQIAFSKFPNNQFARDGNILEWEFDAGFVDPLLGIGQPELDQGI